MTGLMTAPPRTLSPAAAGKTDYLALGYLRAFITVLVVAHHAVLAYYPYAPPRGTSLTDSGWWRAFPVLDSQRSGIFALLVGFNDVFFMSLMFFLSGLFVWNSLQRKGTAAFLRDRVLRLGLPFVLAAAVVAPLAYYPAYLQISGQSSLSGFAREWLSLTDWPAGPAWFVWVLLVFGGVATGLFSWAPRFMPRVGERLSKLANRPGRFFGVLLLISAATYIPMDLIFNGLRWSSFGPFTFQTSRIFHYLAYFLVAAGVGAWGIDRSVLTADGKLARRWPLWIISSVIAFLVVSGLVIAAISTPGSRGLELAGASGFVVSCATSSLAFLALFLRFARSRVAIFDSLRDNAYGIYLLHYAFVSWLQYALLGAALPGLVKGVAVLAGALILSWGTSALIRKIPGVARVI
jgi:hypothetical protein